MIASASKWSPSFLNSRITQDHFFGKMNATPPAVAVVPCTGLSFLAKVYPGKSADFVLSLKRVSFRTRTVSRF